MEACFDQKISLLCELQSARYLIHESKSSLNNSQAKKQESNFQKIKIIFAVKLIRRKHIREDKLGL